MALEWISTTPWEIIHFQFLHGSESNCTQWYYNSLLNPVHLHGRHEFSVKDCTPLEVFLNGQ